MIQLTTSETMLLMKNAENNLKNKKVANPFDLETISLLKKLSRQTGIPVLVPDLVERKEDPTFPKELEANA